MSSTTDTAWRRAALVVAVAAVVAFAGSLRNQFSYDEGLVIVQANRFLQSGALGTLATPRYFAASQEGTYRPVVTLTYMLDRAVTRDLEPAVFKAQSLLWHVGCAILLLLLARRLLPPEQRRFAVVAALLLAVHPVATETVDNASFREDALALFFVLAALLLALRGRLGAASLAYVVALLSKEVAVVFPALLLGLRLLRLDHAPTLDRRRAATEAAVLGAVTVAYLAIRFGPMNTPGAYASFPGGTRAATLLGMPAVFAHYLRLLVAPWPLCADYGGYFDFGPGAFSRHLTAAAAGVLFLGGFVVALVRRWWLMAFGVGWFLLALVPVANIVPVPVPAAERFLYLPIAGIGLALAAAVAAVVARWPASQRPLLVAGVAAALTFVGLCNRRHRDWRDNDSLWAATARENPRSCGAQSALGGARLREGMNTHSRAALEEGAALEERALQLCPPTRDDASRSAVILTRLGAARAVLGRLPAARDALEQAIALAPRYPLAVVWLGYVQFLAGDKRAAENSLRHAVVELGPPDAMVAEVASQYMDKL